MPKQKNKTDLDERIDVAVAYSKSFHWSADQDELRAETSVTNRMQRRSYKEFCKITSPTTEDGLINNRFYRKAFFFDVVIPKYTFDAVIAYYDAAKADGDTEQTRFLEKNIDHIFTFLAALSYYSTRYQSHLFSRRHMTPMSCTFLMDLIGPSYGKIIRFAKMLSLINVDEMFIPGIFDKKAKADKKGICRHYAFTDKESLDHVVHRVSNRSIIGRAYGIRNDGEELGPKFIGNGNTERDEILNDWFSEHFSLDDEADKSSDYDGFAYYHSRIEDGDRKFRNFTIGRDKFGDRMYHPFLNMNKKLRKYVRIDGENGCEVVDLNNSHPYFFSLLFVPEFLENIKHLLTTEEYTYISELVAGGKYKDNIDIFCDITASGNYYSYMQDRVNDGRDVKHTNMYYFYGRVNKRNELYKLFAKDFAYINFVKVQFIKLGGYKRLCQLMQRIESYVMIDKVFNNLRDADVNTIPLHDAFLCRAADTQLVRKEIHDVLIGMGANRLPQFDKHIDKDIFNRTMETVYINHCTRFVNKNIMYEELNEIIKAAGIKNRVFKDGMKEESVGYIDRRFGRMVDADEIPQIVVEKYNELRNNFDSNDFNKFDFANEFQGYKGCDLVKKRWYSKQVVDLVKVNPVEYINHVYGFSYKTRVKESKYIFG